MLKQNKKPNILHIFVDQQRFDTIHALGNSVIKTPNLDWLCRTGVSFTNAFSPSPVCVSARCSMIYGQYPMNTGCYENTKMPQDGRQTFMDALAKAGYRTHGIGKCHFFPDSYELKGFQTRERQEELKSSSLEGEPYLQMLYDKGYTHVCEPHGMRSEMYYIPQISQLPAEIHPSAWIADRSINFISEQEKNDSPWYLYSSFIHPHPPFAPPTPWHKLYRAPMMPMPNVPEDYMSLQTYVNKWQNRYKYRDQGKDNNLNRCIKAFYYGCISFLDFQIGRIIDSLLQSGQLDNTLILFSTDHGELLGDYNCYGKRSMHDAAARIPFIVRYPGLFEGGRVCETPVSLVDIAPTFLEVAGAGIDTHKLDGEDLMSLQNQDSTKRYVFSQLAYTISKVLNDNADNDKMDPDIKRASMSSYMAVNSEWKYIYSAPDNREFLFDKTIDPLETRNRAGLPFCDQALNQMREALFEHLQSGGETAGFENGKWKNFNVPPIPADPDVGLLVQDTHVPWMDDVSKYIKERQI